MAIRNVYNLFMSYYTEKLRSNGCIYRISFSGKTYLNFTDVYNTVIQIFLPKQISIMNIENDIKPYLRSFVIVQTKENHYYLSIFINKVDSSRYDCGGNLLRFFLRLGILNYDYFVENCSNTEYYAHGSDIEFDKALDKFEASRRGDLLNDNHYKGLHSYWNWLHDMTQKDIEKCVLLDGPSFSYNIDEKNMYFTRPYLVELCESPNFYYIHFEKCRPLVGDNYNTILYRSKRRTIRKEYKLFLENTNNYGSFSKYWLHVPNSLSFLPLRHIGLVDTNFRFGYETWYTELSFSKDRSISVNEVYDLFDKQFKNVTELMSVVMLKPKKNLDNYLIFFAIKDYSLKSINMIKSILNDYNSKTEIYHICGMNQNFEVPQWNNETPDIDLGGSRTIEIEINSLVIGLYSKNPEYWISFSHGLGGYVGGLFYYDWLEVNSSFGDSEGWFKTTEDAAFMTHYNVRIQFLFIR